MTALQVICGVFGHRWAINLDACARCGLTGTEALKACRLNPTYPQWRARYETERRLVQPVRGLS